MAEYQFNTYTPDILAYDPATNSFRLDATFDLAADRNAIEVSDNDDFFDGDSTRNERGDDSNQRGTATDSDGNEFASGRIYIESVGVVEAPDGTLISLDRIEIDGEHVGYLSSEPLAPGQSYEYVDGFNVGQNISGSDTRKTFDYYEDNSVEGVPCFGPGTMIVTQDGEMPVEWLEAKDMVLTRDHGFQPILWLGRSKIPPNYFHAFPDERPVRIRAGSLAPGCPTHDLCVTGDHRIMIKSPMAEMLFFSAEVLAPAKAWVEAGLASSVAPAKPYLVTHILCASHQLIVAQGAWVESMFTGTEALRRLPSKDVAQLETLLGDRLHKIETARPCLSKKEAVTLLSLTKASAQQHDKRSA